MNTIKSFFIRYFKGLFIGFAAIIPGFSGGTVAVLLGCYDEMLEAVADILKHPKKSILFLLPLGLGVVSTILALLFPMQWALSHYPFVTVTFFVGLVIGGLPSIYKNVSGKEKPLHFLFFFLSLCVVVLTCLPLFFSETTAIDVSQANIGLCLFAIFAGLLGSFALVVPGVSGSMCLMLVGFYTPILTIATSILKFENLGTNLIIGGCFGVGMLIGFVVTSKVMTFLLKKYRVGTFFAILGFIIGSIFGIYAQVDYALAIDIWQWVIAVGLFVFGAIFSFVIARIGGKHEKIEEVNNG